jgi:hypothetical protein
LSKSELFVNVWVPAIHYYSITSPTNLHLESGVNIILEVGRSTRASSFQLFQQHHTVEPWMKRLLVETILILMVKYPLSMVETPLENRLTEISDGLSIPDSPDFASCIEKLRKLDPGETVIIFEKLIGDEIPAVTAGVARACGELKLKETLDILMRLLDEPGKWFSHSDRDLIRREAVKSIGTFGTHVHGAELFEFLKSPSNPELQSELIRAIGNIGSEELIEPLLQAIDSQPSLALSASGAIAQICGEDAYKGLIGCIRHNNEMVRSASVWALGELGDQRAIQTLVEFAGKSDSFTRRDIVNAIARIGGMKARLVLDQIQVSDPDLIVRREASKAIKAGIVDIGLNKNSVEND